MEQATLNCDFRNHDLVSYRRFVCFHCNKVLIFQMLNIVIEKKNAKSIVQYFILFLRFCLNIKNPNMYVFVRLRKQNESYKYLNN